jgi:hypothetical protein
MIFTGTTLREENRASPPSPPQQYLVPIDMLSQASTEHLNVSSMQSVTSSSGSATSMVDPAAAAVPFDVSILDDEEIRQCIDDIVDSYQSIPSSIPFTSSCTASMTHSVAAPGSAQFMTSMQNNIPTQNYVNHSMPTTGHTSSWQQASISRPVHHVHQHYNSSSSLNRPQNTSSQQPTTAAQPRHVMTAEKAECIQKRVEFMRPLLNQFMASVTEGKAMKNYLSDFYHRVAREFHTAMSQFYSSGQLGYHYPPTGPGVTAVPIYEISLFRALEVTKEFYNHYKAAIIKAIEIRREQEEKMKRDQQQGLNQEQGQQATLYPLPRLSMKSTKAACEICIRDLQGFTFGTRYVPFLDHLLIPTIRIFGLDDQSKFHV